MTQSAGHSSGAIEVRFPTFHFQNISRYYASDNSFLTHLFNAFNAMFPPGEGYMVRAVQMHKKFSKNEQVRAAARGFIGQEVQHANAHAELLDFLRKQGYNTELFEKLLSRVGLDFLAYTLVEKWLGPEYGLTATAAMEHYTATIGAFALETKLASKISDLEIRKLVYWHAMEEIEHKAACYDLMEEVVDSYPKKVAGLVLATIAVFGFSAAGVAFFAGQDKELTLQRFLTDVWDVWNDEEQLLQKLFAALGEYLKPGFHPNDRDDSALLEKAAGMLQELNDKSLS